MVERKCRDGEGSRDGEGKYMWRGEVQMKRGGTDGEGRYEWRGEGEER